MIDHRIPMMIQQPNILAALDAGTQAAGNQANLMRQAEGQNLFRQYGAGAMQGDQRSMNALAGFDPVMAQGMDINRQENRRADQRIQISKEQLGLARQQAAIAAREAKNREEARATAARMRPMMQQAGQAFVTGNQQAFEAIAQEFGVPGLPMNEQGLAFLDALASGFEEGLSGLAPKQGDPTSGMREYDLARAQGFEGSFLDYQEQLAEARRAQTNVNVNTGDSLTPFQEATDKAFATDALEWQQGGGADLMGQTAQLATVLERLERGENLTGVAIAAQPDFMLAFTNPDAVNAREQVEEVVQRNLRLILGAQFTEKEGERLIARAYNPRLKPEINAGRVRRLLLQMQSAGEQKQAMVDYAMKNGTLKGYEGKTPTMADFYAAIEGVEDQPNQGAASGIGVEALSPEAREAFELYGR